MHDCTLHFKTSSSKLCPITHNGVIHTIVKCNISTEQELNKNRLLELSILWKSTNIQIREQCKTGHHTQLNVVPHKKAHMHIPSSMQQWLQLQNTHVLREKLQALLIQSITARVSCSSSHIMLVSNYGYGSMLLHTWLCPLLRTEWKKKVFCYSDYLHWK